MEKIKKLLVTYKKEFQIVIVLLLYVVIVGDCLIKKYTGFPCPTCGLTRAIISLCKGDFYESMHYHLFAVPMMIAVIMYLIKDKVNEKYKKLIMYFLSTIGILLIIYYIYRMCIYFPSIQPMDYNYDSYLFKIFN